jgi:hypothetical protein
MILRAAAGHVWTLRPMPPAPRPGTRVRAAVRSCHEAGSPTDRRRRPVPLHSGAALHPKVMPVHGRGVPRNGTARSWRIDGTQASAQPEAARAEGRLPTGSQRRCPHSDGGQLPGPLEVGGAVPQTALIPVVTWAVFAWLPDFATYSPGDRRRRMGLRPGSTTSSREIAAGLLWQPGLTPGS